MNEENAYKREKAPEAVKEAILTQASIMAVEHGVQSLTLQAVADNAGVTKGGLMHHFRTKAALISAIRNRAVGHFSTALDRNMGNDVGGNGMFTRAYVRTCLETAKGDCDLLLITTLWSDPDLRRDWYSWLEKQENQHEQTDGSIHYKLVRLAADGAWLAAMDGMNTETWEAELLKLTESIS